MFRNLSLIGILCLALFTFSACNHIPEYARYVPKDAALVIGINTKSISKKVAWDAITGSKLFDQMEKNPVLKNMLKDVEKAGVSTNTIYIYAKEDNRFANGHKIITLIPLDDAGKWEAYIKNIFPQTAIKQQGSRKEAMLPYGFYAGWNDKLLIFVNTLPETKFYNHTALNDSSVNNDSSLASSGNNNAIDTTAMAAELDNAFGVTKENALTENKHFKQLIGNGHDVTFWVNYEIIMGQYMAEGMANKMGGLSLANTVWKDAAAASAYDFESGRIKGSMHYYLSDDLREIARDFASNNADKDMIDRLPTQNVDMLMTMHLSTKGLRAMLDKLGVLGLANVALSQQNMNVDYILDAFTGDMAMEINNFILKNQQTNNTDSASNSITFNSYEPSFDFLYVIKINKKENFDKLMQMASAAGMTKTNNNTYVIPLSSDRSVYIMTNDKYAVISNKSDVATDYLQSKNKRKSLPDAADVYGHPFGLFIDIQQVAKAINPGITRSLHDSAMIAESKKLLSNIKVSGGAFNEGGLEYTMEINFINKNENSLLQLTDFALRMNNISNQQ